MNPETTAPAGQAAESQASGRKTPSLSRRRAIAAIIVAAIVAVVLVLVLSGGNSATIPAGQQKTIAGLSEQGLSTLAGALHTPVYWEGAQSGTTYEVTQISDGRIFVRYLPPGVKVGANQRLPFVATLPFANAFPGTSVVAHRPGAVRIPLAPNVIAFYNRRLPTNAWIALRGSNYQIEIFDPNPARMRRLIASNVIQPVSPNAPGAVTASSITAASVAALDALPSRLGHPVYWAGAQPATKYELTLTPAGGVFVRYLPAAANVGANVRYRFVASLPLSNAFVATKNVAARSGSVKIPVPGGAVAFYPRVLPTNVYVAFPGSNYQVELFDPSPQRAHALVSSGLVRPLP